MTLQHERLSTTSLAWSPNWEDVFDSVGQNRPLVVEIGFGYGQMLLYLAHTRPHANILGIEVASKPLATMESRLRRNQLHHVRVMHGYAEALLSHLLEPGSVSEFHVNFPDPWFKTSHQHRRLMKRRTLDYIASRLRVGGRLYLATDIEAYAQMSHALLRATPTLTNEFETAWVNHYPDRARTKYEQKALQEGRTIHYFVYQRNTHPALDLPVIKESPMPHLVFRTDGDLDTIYHAFQREQFAHPEASIYIAMLDVYQNPNSLLFEIHIKEETIEQHVAVLLVRRKDDPSEWVLKLSMLGHPRITHGVHKAVSHLAEIVQRSVPITILHNKLLGYDETLSA